MKKILAATAAVTALAFASSALAANVSPGNPASADASASAQVVGLITLTKDADLNFGKISSAAAGTVALTAEASPTPSATGGVTLLPGTTRTAAKFAVAGEVAQAYTVTVPPTITLTGAPGLTVTVATSALPSVGAADIYVAGSLAVPLNTPAGNYTGNFTVSAAYN